LKTRALRAVVKDLEHVVAIDEQTRRGGGWDFSVEKIEFAEHYPYARKSDAAVFREGVRMTAAWLSAGAREACEMRRSLTLRFGHARRLATSWGP